MSKLHKTLLTRCQEFWSNVRTTKWLFEDERYTSTYNNLPQRDKEKVDREMNEVREFRIPFLLTTILITWNQLRQEFGLPHIDDSEFLRWRHASEEIFVEDMLSGLKITSDIFDRYLSDGEILTSSWRRFKHDIKDEAPWFGVGFLGPIKPLVELVFSSNGDTKLIRACRQALGIVRKTALTTKSVRMTNEAIERFRQFDTQLCECEAGPLIKRFFATHLGGLFAPEEGDFRHGGGAVLEWRRNTSPIFKYSTIEPDALLLYYFRKYGLFPELQGQLTCWKDCTWKIRRCRPFPVPKDPVKFRTISIESTTLQWFQQGCAQALWRYINTNRYLRRRIDQKGNGIRNSNLAQIGSIRGDFATIDLSNASDGISWTLLRGALTDCPTFLDMWRCGRSYFATLPDAKGRITETMVLKKAAGMGSPLTFPTECLLFCAIVEEAIMLDGGDPTLSTYRVHGDDIVVETCYAKTVMERLTHYGFIVNKEKSFYEKRMVWNFRESCGGEFLDGASVSRMRLPRVILNWTLGQNTAELPWEPQAISVANDAYFSGLRDLRDWIVSSWLLKLPRHLQPRFSDDMTDSSAIYSPSATNYHLRRVHPNNDLSQDLVVCGGLRTRYKSSALIPDAHADACVYEHLRRIAHRSHMDGLQGGRDSYDVLFSQYAKRLETLYNIRLNPDLAFDKPVEGKIWFTSLRSVWTSVRHHV